LADELDGTVYLGSSLAGLGGLGIDYITGDDGLNVAFAGLGDIAGIAGDLSVFNAEDFALLTTFSSGLNVTAEISTFEDLGRLNSLAGLDFSSIGLDFGSIGLDALSFSDGLLGTSLDSEGTVYLGDLGLADIQNLGIDHVLSDSDININLGTTPSFNVSDLPNFGDLDQRDGISKAEDDALNVTLNISSADLANLSFMADDDPSNDANELSKFFRKLGDSGVDVVNFMDQESFNAFAGVLNRPENTTFEASINTRSGQDSFRNIEVKIIGQNEDPNDSDGNSRT
jgi:hypothetical protein